jgi:hypothetical protein
MYAKVWKITRQMHLSIMTRSIVILINDIRVPMPFNCQINTRYKYSKSYSTTCILYKSESDTITIFSLTMYSYG